MKLSDYVFEYIKNLGVKHIFYLPGGGAMHLDDSLGHTQGLVPVCMLHEQAAAIASEAYSRISENYAVCVVTSGPGATNAITGLAGAWLDGTPVIFLSGQVKTADLVGNQRIRQFGIQEINIIDIVKPITKYAVQITDATKIKYELEKASKIAKNGKPGPVWLDIPLDIQAIQIDEKKLIPYDEKLPQFICDDNQISQTIELFNKARRPLLILGHGIRRAGAISQMRELIDYLNVPVMTTWNGVDLIEDDYPLFYGRPGAVGQRHANLIQQNADFVLTIGTRLNLLSTGFDFSSFLKNAKHIMVEIDENELYKKSVHPTLAIHSDAKSFLEKMLENKNLIDNQKRTKWLVFCKSLKNKFPLFINEQVPQGEGVNTYSLIDKLTQQLTSDDVFQFTSSGTGADIAMYTYRVKKGQRAFLTKGLASMGFDLPACIGSCLASGRRTVCVTGDGGFMMNIQELATLKSLNLPVKIFVLDNAGYGMIYNSQEGNFKRLTGCTKESGLVIPNIIDIVNSFAIETVSITCEDELDKKINQVLEMNEPIICSVKVYIGQKITPRQTNYVMPNGQMSSRPLDDMSPLLEQSELEDIKREAQNL